MPLPPDFNPYASPVPDAPPPTMFADNLMRLKLQQFRSRMHTLGGFWIFLGIIVLAVMIVIGLDARPLNEVTVITLAILGAGGLTCLVLGVLTLIKFMPAVYIGLALSYLSGLGGILQCNICWLVMLLPGIVQAHQVIALAMEIRRARIPLDARPDRVHAPDRLPPGFFDQ